MTISFSSKPLEVQSLSVGLWEIALTYSILIYLATSVTRHCARHWILGGKKKAWQIERRMRRRRKEEREKEKTWSLLLWSLWIKAYIYRSILESEPHKKSSWDTEKRGQSNPRISKLWPMYPKTLQPVLDNPWTKKASTFLKGHNTHTQVWHRP